METEKKRGVTGGTLKRLAVVTMLIDHITAVCFLTWYWPLRRAAGLSPVITNAALTWYWLLRGVGRIAFPIYCFLLVEGFFHTRNVKKYLGRLLVFGLVSEIPYDLAFDRVWFEPDSQNVYFTLFLGLLAIELWHVLARDCFHRPPSAKNAARVLAAGICVGMCMYTAHYLHTDYDWKGVLVIFWMYFFRENGWLRFLTAGPALLGAGVIEAVSWPDFLLFRFYNGQRGRQSKFFFYVFYPAHLSLLVLIRYLAAGL